MFQGRCLCDDFDTQWYSGGLDGLGNVSIGMTGAKQQHRTTTIRLAPMRASDLHACSILGSASSRNPSSSQRCQTASD